MKVLVVDDIVYSRRALRSVFLSAGWAVLMAEDGQQGLEVAQAELPDLIVTDILMPRMDGFQLCGAIKSDPALKRIPVIFYTGSYGEAADRELGIQLGAAAYLIKPLEPRQLLDEVSRALGRPPIELKAPTAETLAHRDLSSAYAERIQAKLQEKIAELNRTVATLDDMVTGTVAAFGLALAHREGQNPIEAERAARLALLFCERVAPELAADPNVLRGFLLHDVGKLMLSDGLLKKVGPLTPEEWDEFKREPRLAADILRNVPGLGRALDIVRHARERWDGSGYPDALAGDAIPLGARIFAIADTFEAMTSGRPYSARHSVAQAVVEIRRRAGTHLDPGLVEPFIILINELLPG